MKRGRMLEDRFKIYEALQKIGNLGATFYAD
ncbi:hypothetical protein SDC9_167018 [bioreactor metagenome]|uniref:Uncharacterized protein n=1 Tax=bioreactor metagenome TaxID=1076179 RepID=A0A645G0H2_9ZZZZ